MNMNSVYYQLVKRREQVQVSHLIKLKSEQ